MQQELMLEWERKIGQRDGREVYNPAKYVQFHREFVNTMYPFFGLKENPGYVRQIVVRPMLFCGGLTTTKKKGQFRIFISDYTESYKKRDDEYIVYHESAHFLDAIVNFDRIKQRLKRKPTSDMSRDEIIADFASLEYIALTEGEEEAMKFTDYGSSYGKVAGELFVKMIGNVDERRKLLLGLVNGKLQEVYPYLLSILNLSMLYDDKTERTIKSSFMKT
ncbi:MAG: hypothetical protein AABW80_02565 [Nanoarchaeota archaeon]